MSTWKVPVTVTIADWIVVDADNAEDAIDKIGFGDLMGKDEVISIEPYIDEFCKPVRLEGYDD